MPIYFLFTFLMLLVAIALSIFASGPLSWSSGLLYIAYDTVLLVFVSYRIAKILRRPKLSKPVVIKNEVTLAITVAVVIAARNERSQLDQCLDALFKQTDLPDEIHVVDDGSTDGSIDYLSSRYALVPEGNHLRSKTFPRLLIWPKTHTGKADSLNQVWPYANGDVIITIDADTFVESDAIEKVRLAFAQDGLLIAAGGTLNPRGLKTVMGKIFEVYQKFEYIRAFLSRRAWMDINALILVSGAFAAYRKKGLERIQGFSTNSLVEDYDLIYRLYRSYCMDGEKIHVQVLSDARASTDVPGTFGTFLKQRRRWFAGFLLTHFQNADMVGNRKFGPMGRIMLPVKSVDTLQPVYGVVAFVTLVCLIVTEGKVNPFILAVILIKLGFDLFFHFWSVSLYYRWQNTKVPISVWVLAVLATVTEPITFQLLRHIGAVWGWFSIFRKNNDWLPNR